MRRRQCGSLFWEASFSSSDTFPVFRSSLLLLHLLGDRAPLDCRNARIFHGVDGDPLSFCSFSCTCFLPPPFIFSKAVAAHDDNSQDEEAEKCKNDQMPPSDALPVFPSPPKASVSHINFRKEKGEKL